MEAGDLCPYSRILKSLKSGQTTQGNQMQRLLLRGVVARDSVVLNTKDKAADNWTTVQQP